MNPEDKTRNILRVLDSQSIIRDMKPSSRPRDSSISPIDRLSLKSSFSIFNPSHIRAASKLIKRLLAANEFDDYMKIVQEALMFENDGMFLYSLYTSVRHRDDCIGVVLPPIEEEAPHWFFAAETIHEAIQRAIKEPNADHLVTNLNTANVNDEEAQLAYFREDIGMNRHHWSWHVVFPSYWDESVTKKVKDRKGEIFYYMHQQMLARYDSERLSNYLGRVVPLRNFQEEMEAYFPHLTSQKTGVHFSSRPPGMKMQNITNISLEDMEMWRDRILNAIDLGYVRGGKGDKITLGNEKGIDILGAIVEASSASVNPEFYGNLHAGGHLLISSCHDPDDRFRLHPAVMGFSESAARDPIFYRWHKYIDEILTRHKNTLRPYTREELSFEGIKVINAEVQGTRKNIMETFMRDARSDLSDAPFLKTIGKILIQYEHLDHEPLTFTYTIKNDTGEDKDVTIRVFLAPKFDASGNPFDLNVQRRLMIELDKIQEHLTPGMNTITRVDSDSSVTVSRQIRSYRSLKAGNVAPPIDYCTCGWPEHMLIPKGTTDGMDFNLFVMCTDFKEDKPASLSAAGCSGAISYCGSRDEKYPDTKPMGFPFDRRILASSMGEATDNTFLTDNMFLTDVKIIFSNRVRPITDWTSEMYENTKRCESSEKCSF